MGKPSKKAWEVAQTLMFHRGSPDSFQELVAATIDQVATEAQQAERDALADTVERMREALQLVHRDIQAGSYGTANDPLTKIQTETIKAIAAALQAEMDRYSDNERQWRRSSVAELLQEVRTLTAERNRYMDKCIGLRATKAALADERDALRAELAAERDANPLRLTADEIDGLLERWDETDPKIQRGIVVKFATLAKGSTVWLHERDALTATVERMRTAIEKSSAMLADEAAAEQSRGMSASAAFLLSVQDVLDAALDACPAVYTGES